MPTPAKLKKRKDFLRAYKNGISLATKSIVIQAVRDYNNFEPRIGYTSTKRLGGAVVRNKCRRRLKAVAAIFFAQYALPNTNYVLVGRHNTATIDFDTLCKDFIYGIKKANKLLYGEPTNDKQNNKPAICHND